MSSFSCFLIFALGVFHTDLSLQTGAFFVDVVEVAHIFHVIVAVREEVAVQFDEIIVGHTGDVVHHNLIRLGLLVRHLTMILGIVDVDLAQGAKLRVMDETTDTE